MGVSVIKLLDAVEATGEGAVFPAGAKYRPERSFQALVEGTGAVTAEISVEATLDNENWMSVGIITLSGTTTDTDGFVIDAPWIAYRGNCTDISGTDAAVTLWMGG